MKGWLGRAEANTVLRGAGGSRIAAWSRWFRRTGPVADSNFQGSGDLYPRHWRRFPPPWPSGSAKDAAVRQRLGEALEDLPPTWRAVVDNHDVIGRSDADVASELGITREQERNILTRARAALREQLDERYRRGGKR